MINNSPRHYIEKYSLIDNTQCGSRQIRSTRNCLMVTESAIRQAIIKKCVSVSTSSRIGLHRQHYKLHMQHPIRHKKLQNRIPQELVISAIISVSHHTTIFLRRRQLNQRQHNACTQSPNSTTFLGAGDVFGEKAHSHSDCHSQWKNNHF